MTFTCPWQEANLLPRYYLTSLLPLTPLISPLFSVVSTWFGVGVAVLKWSTSYLTEHYQLIKIVQLCLIFVNSYLVLPEVPFWALCYSHCTLLLVGKHKGIKFYFYAYDTQVYVRRIHLLPLKSWTDAFMIQMTGFQSVHSIWIPQDWVYIILFKRKERECSECEGTLNGTFVN